MFERLFVLGVLVFAGAGYAETLKDPTRPINPARVAENKAVELPNLQSVVFSGDRRVAIIDGTVAREGSTIGGVRLVAIRRNEVDVDVAGHGRYVLRLGARVNKEVN